MERNLFLPESPNLFEIFFEKDSSDDKETKNIMLNYEDS